MPVVPLWKRWERVVLIRRRFQNERPWITEPPSEDGEEVRPNTSFIKLNAPALIEMLEFLGFDLGLG